MIKEILKLTDKDYWAEHWRNESEENWAGYDSKFSPDWDKLMESTLEKFKGKKLLEVGCYPGRYMMYFHKKYKMEVEGLDFVEDISDNKNFKIYKEDFLKWSTSNNYDIVCSFGFIEHFYDLENIIKKHLELTNPKGLSLITVPNFHHGIKYFFKRRNDRELFVSHYREAMNIESLKKILDSIPCKSYEIDFFSFSKKGFNSSYGAKYYIAKLLGFFTLKLPLIDNLLADEIIIKIKK